MAQPPSPESPASFRWFLESLVEGGRQLRRMAIHPLPFRVGRRPGLDLTLPSDAVSKEHAEFYQDGSGLRVRDLASKNGTFVNHDRIQDASVREGDIIHFAYLEFRLGRQEVEEPGRTELEPVTRSISDLALTHQFIEGIRELPELLEQGLITCVFQPIVSLPGGAIMGYEALGRGRHPRLPEGPIELFQVAAGVGAEAEAELSRLFRRKALELVAGRRDLPSLFLNTHPAELEQPNLLESLADVRRVAPDLRLILEIHEGALADLASVGALRTQLAKMGIGLAYDDFGAGQARLLELAEVPPHFLKFDMRFVHKIDEAPPSRQHLLTSLVSVARDLLVYTVAEGVETPEEADVCAKIGFTHAQGYFYGRPEPIEEI